jgi:hypothetical protein
MLIGRCLGIWVLVVGLCVPGAQSQTQDALPLLAAARTALGGDAALSAITSFSVTGSMTRMVGVNASSSVDVKCILPDRFLRVVHQTMDSGPLGSFTVTRYEGFNRADPLYQVVAPQAPVPFVIPAGPAPSTPDELAAARLRQANAGKRLFVSLALPLFAASFDGHPLTFTAGGQVQSRAGTADAVVVKGPDGFEWRLLLDASSHLPVALTWMAKPIVTMSSTGTMTVNSRTGAVRSASPPILPAGDPTAGLPDVVWEMTISDYRQADGVNWPHRMATTIAGNNYEDLRLGRFRLNPSIDAKVFAPRK